MAEDPKKTEAASKAAQDLKAAADATTRSFQEQLRIMQQMQAVMQQLAGSMQQMGQQEGSCMSPEKWDETAKAVEKATGAMKGASSVTEKLSNVMKSKLLKSLTVAVGAVEGLYQGFKNTVALGKGILGVFSSIAGGAFSIGRAIISIPFKMLEGLIGMAQQGGGGNELAQAYENVRKEFGDLKSQTSSTIIGVAKGMGQLQDVGVSATAIFGNLAERIEAVTKLATGMGASFQVFQGEISRNGEAIMRYQKGLGLTDEQMSGLASNALRMGKGIAEVQNEMTKQALGMSKAFGVNAKVISKDMGKAMQDLAHFGHLSTKELAVAATFANKLGVSVDKLTGIMDATATFDQAAEGMSKLNEQFGTNIDATEIMMEQNPAKKVEMLRKEFMKTGKDIANMTYQERMLIKQSSGLTDEMLNAALSSKNAKVGLSEMEKAAEKNEKMVMSQTKALRALSDSMERLIKSGDTGKGGFFEHFFEGMKRGMQSSPEFMELMRNIRLSLREATMQGVKLGRMFVDLFPGVKDVFGGLAEIFRPQRFREFFGGILKAFDVFKDGGTGKMEDFMNKLKENFFNFFDKQTPAGTKVVEGFQKFGKAVISILGSLSEWVVKKMADIIEGIVQFMETPKGVKVPNMSPLAEHFMKSFQGTFDTIVDRLWPALLKLWDKILDKLKQAALESDWKVKLAFAINAFGPALTNVFGATLGNWMREKGTGLIKEHLVGPLSKYVGDQLTRQVGQKAAEAAAERAAAAAAQAAQASAQTAAAAVGEAAAGAATTAGTAGATAAAASTAAIALGVGAALAAGAAIGYAMDKLLTGIADSNRKKLTDAHEDFMKNLDKFADDPAKRVKLAQEELQKISRDTEGELSGAKGFFNALFGNPEAIAAEAENRKFMAEKILKQSVIDERKAARAAVQGTPEWIEKQEKERNAAAAAAQEKALKDLGPVTIDNAAARFKKIDDLAKQVMGKDFDVESKLATVRKKLENVNWSILSPTKETEVNKTLNSLESVQKVVANIADIGGLINVAAEKMSSAGNAFSKGSASYNALSPDGNIAGAIKRSGEMFAGVDFNKVKTTAILAGESIEPFNKLIDLNKIAIKFDESASNLSEASINTGIKKTINTTKVMVAAMKDLESALGDAANGIKISTRLGAIAGKYGLGSTEAFTVQKKDVVLNISLSVTMDAGKVEKAIILNKDSIIRDRINFALGAGTGKDSTVPESIMSSGQGSLTMAAPSVQ